MLPIERYPEVVEYRCDRPVAEYVVLIQSAYSELHLSEARLRQTERFTVPCLQAQDYRPKLQVSLCRSDPLLESRKDLFRSTGLEVNFHYRDDKFIPVAPWNIVSGDNWLLEPGVYRAVQRLDDDDGISVDYCRYMKDSIERSRLNRAVFEWQDGYSYFSGNLWKGNFNKWPNQWCAIVSETGCHPHEMCELALGAYYRRVSVMTGSRGWLWNRHGETFTNTPKFAKIRKAGRVRKDRWAFPVDIRP